MLALYDRTRLADEKAWPGGFSSGLTLFAVSSRGGRPRQDTRQKERGQQQYHHHGDHPWPPVRSPEQSPDRPYDAGARVVEEQVQGGGLSLVLDGSLPDT